MEQQRKPEPGDGYRHFKDKLYEVVTLAIHSETEEEMVVYRQKYGEFKTYVRPLSMFLSEVDHEKYPEAVQKYRFELESALEDTGTDKEEPFVQEGLLYQFLDANTLREKLKILEDRKETPTDLAITNMAMSVDVVVNDGPPEERIEELIDCLRTLARFECTRLR